MNYNEIKKQYQYLLMNKKNYKINTTLNYYLKDTSIIFSKYNKYKKKKKNLLKNDSFLFYFLLKFKQI